nr:MAG TPA: hypothetical protein [Caudoviricetes sp.]
MLTNSSSDIYVFLRFVLFHSKNSYVYMCYIYHITKSRPLIFRIASYKCI